MIIHSVYQYRFRIAIRTHQSTRRIFVNSTQDSSQPVLHLTAELFISVLRLAITEPVRTPRNFLPLSAESTRGCVSTLSNDDSILSTVDRYTNFKRRKRVKGREKFFGHLTCRHKVREQYVKRQGSRFHAYPDSNRSRGMERVVRAQSNSF